MKNLIEIKREAEKGDYVQVARMVDKSPSLVREVIKGARKDHHGIQRAFSDLLEGREKILRKAVLARKEVAQ